MTYQRSFIDMCRNSLVDNSVGMPVQDDIFVSTESLNLDQNSPMEIPYKNKMLRLNKHESIGFREPSRLKNVGQAVGAKKLLRPTFTATNSQQKLIEKSKLVSETKFLLGKSDSSIEFLSLSSADPKPL